MIWRWLSIVAVALLVSRPGSAAENAGTARADDVRPFRVETVATFDRPWSMAFLSHDHLLVTEKAGRMFVVSRGGDKVPVANVPNVYDSGQNGLLDVVAGRGSGSSPAVFFSYVEPAGDGGALVLARARLGETDRGYRLTDRTDLWRQQRPSRGGQAGGIIAFSPDGRHLFFSVGDRQEPATAQDPDRARGKILRMLPDGTVPRDNPMAGRSGIRALTWSTGHRNPYGLAFAPDGTLWEHEMGPRGGDEFNRILPGRNYGWPVVSNGDHYDGSPIPRHSDRPEFEPPALYWTPVISPSGLIFYEDRLFSDWRGAALVGGLSSKSLVRIAVGPDGAAHQTNRWRMKRRIRDVAAAPDGAVWLLEDGPGGALLRLTPNKP